MAKSNQPETTTAEATKIPGKKRYSAVMDTIHKMDRLLEKLTPQERMQVYLWFKNQYEPPLLNQGLEPK